MSECEECKINICDNCNKLGHTNTDPAFRACKKCQLKGHKCTKQLVLVECQDCTPLNKKILDKINSDRKNKVAQLPHLRAAPDAVHDGKDGKTSFSNWYLIFEEERSNLSVIRNLRVDKEVGTKLRNILPLDVVRNKDRMDTKCFGIMQESSTSNCTRMLEIL